MKQVSSEVPNFFFNDLKNFAPDSDPNPSVLTSLGVTKPSLSLISRSPLLFNRKVPFGKDICCAVNGVGLA